MEPSESIIRARSRRQVMDWALALASQGIEAAVVRLEDGGWGLSVAPQQMAAALATLRQYHIENRGWPWRQALPASGLVFHTGSFLWAAALAAIYYVCEVRFPKLENAGMVESRAVLAGQWWRLFTAVTLHANVPHLMANVTSGCLFLGLAMARFGAGMALLTTFLGGALGNLAGIYLYGEHSGLGASGMVMAALGLLATQTFGWWRGQGRLSRLLWEGGVAAILILVLLGFSPEADVVAHVGGFVSGAIFGGLLSLAKPGDLQKGGVNSVALAATLALTVGTWAMVR